MTFYGFSLAKSMLQEPELCIQPPGSLPRISPLPAKLPVT